jgi:hypothetical protein
MIDFSKTRAFRKRRDSVEVAGKDYPIRTEFCHWLSYDKKIRRGRLRLNELDFLYLPFNEGGKGVPEDREAGRMELHAFYLNKQPLPRDSGRRSGIIAFDWLLDSEYIYAAFMERYGISLIERDLHWHDFLALFGALKDTCFNEIKAIRVGAAKGKEAGEARRAWAITEYDIQKANGRKEKEEFLVMGR